MACMFDELCCDLAIKGFEFSSKGETSIFNELGCVVTLPVLHSAELSEIQVLTLHGAEPNRADCTRNKSERCSPKFLAPEFNFKTVISQVLLPRSAHDELA